MKKIVYTIAFVSISLICIQAQNEKFVGAMKKQIAILDTAQKVETLTGLSNTFERIANAEKKEWTAYYYTAYAMVRKAYAKQETKSNDETADNAEKFLKLADSLNPNNSEISCIKSMIAGLRMMVDPMTRGQKYGMESNMWLMKSKEQDPSNPRPYMLAGQGKFYTPPQWGGGKDKAKIELEEAKKRFETFKPTDDIAPNWGKMYNDLLLSQCTN
jgi:hypothetical protein